MINYLCTEESQETIFKDQRLCIFNVFLSLKEMCVLSIYVDACDECRTREATWLRKEEGEIRSKRRKPSEGCWDARLRWYHADRAC